jgi:hypothetical protein
MIYPDMALYYIFENRLMAYYSFKNDLNPGTKGSYWGIKTILQP